MDDDGEIDAVKATPFIYVSEVDSVQVLVVPSAMKEVKLPGVGKKGGCDDWQVKPLKTTDSGANKFIIESKGGNSQARHLESILNTRFANNLSQESKSEMTRTVFETHLYCLTLRSLSVNKLHIILKK